MTLKIFLIKKARTGGNRCALEKEMEYIEKSVIVMSTRNKVNVVEQQTGKI